MENEMDRFIAKIELVPNSVTQEWPKITLPSDRARKTAAENERCKNQQIMKWTDLLPTSNFCPSFLTQAGSKITLPSDRTRKTAPETERRKMENKE